MILLSVYYYFQKTKITKVINIKEINKKIEKKKEIYFILDHNNNYYYLSDNFYIYYLNNLKKNDIFQKYTKLVKNNIIKLYLYGKKHDDIFYDFELLE